MNKWNTLASKETVEEVIKNLEPRGIKSTFVETAEEAKQKVLEMLPEKSRVLVTSSETAGKMGLTDAIENSPNLVSVKKEYMALDHQKDNNKIRTLRSTPDIIIGSVHAVTKSGEVLTVSNTGSQLGAYAYSSPKVIWVVGTQKIVENIEEGFKRIYEHTLGLESDRLQKLYGVPSNVSKILTIDKEVVPDRITLIFVNEALGF